MLLLTIHSTTKICKGAQISTMVTTLSAISIQKTTETASFADFGDKYGFENCLCPCFVFCVLLQSLEIKEYNMLMTIIKLQQIHRQSVVNLQNIFAKCF